MGGILAVWKRLVWITNTGKATSRKIPGIGRKSGVRNLAAPVIPPIFREGFIGSTGSRSVGCTEGSVVLADELNHSSIRAVLC